jgi:hypothetical protein
MPPRKRKPQPLHVSLQLIDMERLNVARRTQTRIDVLLGRAQIIYNEPEDVVPAETNGNYCLITFCSFVLLVLMSLLFLQWLYYKVNKVNQL